MGHCIERETDKPLFSLLFVVGEERLAWLFEGFHTGRVSIVLEAKVWYLMLIHYYHNRP